MRKYKNGELRKTDVIINRTYNIEDKDYVIADGDWGRLYGAPPKTPVVKFTKCRSCKTNLASWGTKSECPKCYNEVFLS